MNGGAAAACYVSFAGTEFGVANLVSTRRGPVIEVLQL